GGAGAIADALAPATGGVPAVADVVTENDLRAVPPRRCEAGRGGGRHVYPGRAPLVRGRDGREGPRRPPAPAARAVRPARAGGGGKSLLCRGGPPCVRGRIGQEARARRTAEEAFAGRPPGAGGGLVVIGSHVGLTPRQLEALLAGHPAARVVELQVDELLRG